MLAALDELVEQRIREAMRKGELSGLPGEGRPLALDDDSMVPEELRVAYRILKNAGYAPPEVEALRELNGLDFERRAAPDVGVGERRGERKLLALTLALEAQGLRLTSGAAGAYRQRLAERFASPEPRAGSSTG